MEKQDIENNNEQVIKIEEKKKRGPKGGVRSDSTKWRYRENGTYDNRPIACNAYFNAYMCRKVSCPNCGKLVAYSSLKRHLNKVRNCTNDLEVDENKIKSKQQEIINLINQIKSENKLDTIIKKYKANTN
jgi:hypothetical protein